MTIPRIFALGLLFLMLSACVPAAVGGAAYTATAASEKRGIGGAISDAELQAKLNDKWFKADLDLYDRLDMTVHRGRVLLTGAAKDEAQRVEAVRLTWEVDGVQDVYNEITIDNGRTVIDSAEDTWIRTQVSARLTFDPEIKSQNYYVDTVGRVVYLLGEAVSQEELDRVIAQAKSVAGVQRVVSYVTIP